jgi:hypothetical protein
MVSSNMSCCQLTQQEFRELATRAHELQERLHTLNPILNSLLIEQADHMRTLQTTDDPKIYGAVL